MNKIYTLLTALTITAISFAQAPEKISYQAIVRDAGNALVSTQTVGMQLSILQGSITGPAVYVETQMPSSNINGLVSIEIGSGTVVSGAFNTIDWSAGPYYIKTETDPTGGTTYTITGTSQLMSVPYALHSKTAENVTNDQVDDADADPTNEIQDISLTGMALSISGGSNVDLTTIQDGTGTDDQNISGSGLSGTDLTIGIEGGTSEVVNLSSLQDGTGTDDQNLTGATLTGTTLQVDIENGTSTTVDLAVLQDGTGTDDQNISGSGLSGTDLTIGIEGGTSEVVNLSSLQDGTGTDDQNLTLNGTNLSIEAGNTVNLSSIVDDGDWVLSGNDMYNSNTGNIGIGTTQGAAKVVIRGSGSTSLTDALLVENSAGTDILKISDDGRISFNGNNSASQLYNTVPNSSTLSYAQRNYFYRSSTTSGSMYGIYSYTNRGTGATSGPVYSIYGYGFNNVGLDNTYGVRGYASGNSSGTKYGVYGSTGGNGIRYAGFFSGNVYCSGAYLPSDEGLKRNISDYDDALDQLSYIEVKEYEYIHDGDFSKMDLPKGRQVGIMAQNIEHTFPQLTKETEFDLNEDPENEDPERKSNILKFKAVNYTGMIPITVKAIQEQQDIINGQKEKIQSLETQMHEMKKMMELQQAQIEKLIGQSNNND